MTSEIGHGLVTGRDRRNILYVGTDQKEGIFCIAAYIDHVTSEIGYGRGCRVRARGRRIL
jgi:hypothetical protein